MAMHVIFAKHIDAPRLLYCRRESKVVSSVKPSLFIHLIDFNNNSGRKATIICMFTLQLINMVITCHQIANVDLNRNAYLIRRVWVSIRDLAGHSLLSYSLVPNLDTRLASIIKLHFLVCS
jgi:hypothetical protein